MNDHQDESKTWRKYTPCGCLLLMFVMGIGLPLLGWIVWSANAARLVEDELAEIRQANEPLELADLAAFYALPPGKADATQLWVEAAWTFENASFNEVAREFPIIGQGPDIPPIGGDWEQLEAVEAFLEEYKDEMGKIHEAAQLGGYARFDRDFEAGFAMLLPQVQGLRSCARMLTLEARVAAHRGDADAVARSIHAMFATCRAVEEDPLLISHLVRVALAGMAANELEFAVGSIEFSGTDLQMLREDIRSVDLRHSLERSLMGERVSGIHAFRNPGLVAGQPGIPFAVRANNEDLALYLSAFAKFLDASRQPFPQALSLAEQATFDVNEVAGGSQVNRTRYAFTIMILPSVNATFAASARATGTAACADTALAIAQYRRTNGSLPTTLTELVPEFLDAVPMDPIDGNPLRYIVTGEGYVLYSIGRNGVDDGGVLGDERMDEVFSVNIKPTKAATEANK